MIVPYTVAGKSSTRLQVQFQGRLSPEAVLPVAETAPALFSSNGSGKGPGMVLNQSSEALPQTDEWRVPALTVVHAGRGYRMALNRT